MRRGPEPGEFDKRVTVEKLATNVQPDEAGHAQQTWEVHCECWAKFMPQRGREFFQAKQLRSDLSHLIRLPWDSRTLGITPEMRLTFKDRGVQRTINIVDSHEVQEDNREIEIQGIEQR